MRVPTRVLLTVFFASAIASCGVPIRSQSSFARGADVGGRVTFAWNQEADRAIGDPRLQNNQFFEDRLHEAIEWELSLRGFRRVESSPDLLVHHHLTLAEHELLVEEVIDDAGSTMSEVYTYEQGTVVVHVADARSGDDIWLAWAQANVEPALKSPENMRGWVYSIVQQMFKDWPVPGRAGQE